VRVLNELEDWQIISGAVAGLAGVFTVVWRITRGAVISVLRSDPGRVEILRIVGDGISAPIEILKNQASEHSSVLREHEAKIDHAQHTADAANERLDTHLEDKKTRRR
jgi:hypothetical protein